jgi:hypothetical protein
MRKKETIKVQGSEITVITAKENDYISLTEHKEKISAENTH